jgi:hypothetical protein
VKYFSGVTDPVRSEWSVPKLSDMQMDDVASTEPEFHLNSLTDVRCTFWNEQTEERPILNRA